VTEQSKIRTDEINTMRAELGLPLIQEKTTVCLKCEKPFMSWNVRTNRLCPQCRTQSNPFGK
jgi:uncharacterized CHY-type Zn-finger protein